MPVFSLVFFLPKIPAPTLAISLPAFSAASKLFDTPMLTPHFPFQTSPNSVLRYYSSGRFLHLNLIAFEGFLFFFWLLSGMVATRKKRRDFSIYDSKRRDYPSLVPGTSKFKRMSNDSTPERTVT